jgi:hypothetical protein
MLGLGDVPAEAAVKYGEARAMAARGEVDAAVTALREAVTAGWARPRVLERDEVLGVLRGVRWVLTMEMVT